MDDLTASVSYERIPISLIEPDPDNPRKEFADLDKTAAGFEANFINPGEPFNPPIVVRDGDGYRLENPLRYYYPDSNIVLIARPVR